MTLGEAVRRFTDVIWSENKNYFKAGCPFCSGNVRVSLVGGKAFIICNGGCEALRLRKWLYDTTSQSAAAQNSTIRPDETNLSSTARHSTGAGEPSPAPLTYETWRDKLVKSIHGRLTALPESARLVTASRAKIRRDEVVDTLVGVGRQIVEQWQPDELSETAIDEEIHAIAEGAVTTLLRNYQPTNGHHPVPAKEFTLPLEDYEAAIAANQEYLKRAPVVEALLYAGAVSMITGGKHAGKSTLARWLAICVAKGIPFLGRAVEQGRVLYLASEDEELAARTELTRLGWGKDVPLAFMSLSKIEEDAKKILEGIVHHVEQVHTQLVIMDMLFDFARISDEMSYAQTREAVGGIQHVATRGVTHVVTVHHSPKHASATAEAAVTALGSQGLAARVTPIILVRRHGQNVHSVVSTTVRDPRGEPIEESRLLRLTDGSVMIGNKWSDFMQAEVYAPRVQSLFESEPGQEMTRLDVQMALDISQQLASACLTKLVREGRVYRAGSGKKGSPFRYSMPLTDPSQISETDGKTVDQNGTQVVPVNIKKAESEMGVQEAFSYKASLSPKPLTPPGDDAPEPAGYTLPDKYGIPKGD